MSYEKGEQETLAVTVKKDSSLSKPTGPSTCSNLHWADLFGRYKRLGGVAFSGEDQLVELRPELTPNYGEGEETVRCGLSELQYTIIDRYQTDTHVDLVASGPDQELVDALRYVELCTIRAWKSNEMLHRRGRHNHIPRQGRLSRLRRAFNVQAARRVLRLPKPELEQPDKDDTVRLPAY